MTLINKSLQFGTRQCKEFRAIFFRRHYMIAEELAYGYLRSAKNGSIEGNAIGNRWLLKVDERLRLGQRRISAASDDDDIKLYCNLVARDCEKSYVLFASRRGFDDAIEVVKRKVEREGFEWPAKYNECDLSEFGAEGKREKDAGAVARVSDPMWWRRKLRKAAGVCVEKELRDIGLVSKKASPYVSEWAFKRWCASQVRNRGTLQNMLAIADDGTELNLVDCVDASVSNPINRRNELMVRMRGFEEVAESRGMKAVLFTLTAPSKYHAILSTGGRNEKFEGFTPAQAQEYLCKVWARIRSDWARNEIATFGFRVCEPHHDATPHFHLLLFFMPENLDEAKKIFGSHALAVDGDEEGAALHRWDCVEIDKEKGSAAGYIAKYISKNIDGFGFQGDEVDEEAETPAPIGALRARAWASLWSIRQFQQIGVTPVTVYRELRREQLSSHPNPEEVDRAKNAADAGNWREFVEAMGGPFAKRKDLLLRPRYVNKDKLGKYGEEIKKLLGIGLGKQLNGYKGSFVSSFLIETRLKEWVIKMAWNHAPPDRELNFSSVRVA